MHQFVAPRKAEEKRQTLMSHAFGRVVPQVHFGLVSWLNSFSFFLLFYFYCCKGAEELGDLLERKQTFLVLVTTDASLPFPSLPISVPSLDVTGAPPWRCCWSRPCSKIAHPAAFRPEGLGLAAVAMVMGCQGFPKSRKDPSLLFHISF